MKVCYKLHYLYLLFTNDLHINLQLTLLYYSFTYMCGLVFTEISVVRACAGHRFESQVACASYLTFGCRTWTLKSDEETD